MKKALALLLILAAAGGLFAQDLKFDGYINSGLGLFSSNEKKDGERDPKLRAFGTDSEQYGYRFRLNGSFTGEEGSAGVKFRLQSQSTAAASNGGYFSLPFAYGWVKMLDGKITVNGGLVDDGTWNSGGGILDDDVGEGLGALARVSPIEGLDLGVGAYTISTNSGGNNNVLMNTNFSTAFVKPANAKYTFSAGYTMPDLFRVTAVFRTKNDAAYDDVNDPTKANNIGREEPAKAIAAFRILAVKNLTAVVEGEFDYLNDFNDKGIITVYETLGYKAGNLGLGLNMAQYFSQAEDTDIGLRFNPWLSYTINSIVPRLDLVYFLAGVPDTPGKYHRKNYKVQADYRDGYSILTARPSVKFNLNSKTFIEIGDLFSYEMGPADTYGEGDDTKSSRMTNAVYVDFKWSF